MILDTNALSAMADGNPAVIDELARVTRIDIPVIVLGEYRFGIAQSRRMAAYEHWITETLTGYSVLDVTEETAVHYADLRLELKKAGTPLPVNDVWIGALARQHRLPILSRDRHFDLIPNLRRVGW